MIPFIGRLMSVLSYFLSADHPIHFSGICLGHPRTDRLAEVVARPVLHSRSDVSTTANVFREVSSSTSSRASPLLRRLKIVPPERRHPPEYEAIVELEVGEEEVRDQI